MRFLYWQRSQRCGRTTQGQRLSLVNQYVQIDSADLCVLCSVQNNHSRMILRAHSNYILKITNEQSKPISKQMTSIKMEKEKERKAFNARCVQCVRLHFKWLNLCREVSDFFSYSISCHSCRGIGAHLCTCMHTLWHVNECVGYLMCRCLPVRFRCVAYATHTHTVRPYVSYGTHSAPCCY